MPQKAGLKRAKAKELARAVSREKVPVAIILMEIVLFILFLAELLAFFQVSFEERSIIISSDPTPLLLMAIIAFILFSIHFAAKKKNARVYQLHDSAKNTVRGAVKRKLRSPKDNPVVIARLLIEIAYVAIIVFGIYFILDPEEQMVDWQGFFSQLGEQFTGNAFIVGPELNPLFNLILFAIITFIFIWLYVYSTKFDSLKFRGVKENIAVKRKERAGKRKREKG